MSAIVKRYLVLFVTQLSAFHIAYALFLADSLRTIIFLIVWLLAWMTWFIIANQHVKKKWLHIPLAFIISATAQVLSWISFLYLLFAG